MEIKPECYPLLPTVSVKKKKKNTAASSYCKIENSIREMKKDDVEIQYVSRFFTQWEAGS